MPALSYAATVTWISDADGNWSDGANWSTGTPPQEGDDVVIDRPTVDVTVTISNQTEASVRTLDCQENLHLNLSGLTVTNIADVWGEFRLNYSLLTVEGGAASFTAHGPTNIDQALFYVNGGGQAALPNATSYSSNEAESGYAVISVTGAGSLLDLSSVQTFDSGNSTGVGPYQSFIASNGGVLDLSGVHTINSHGGGNYSRFLEQNGGQIDLTLLGQVYGSKTLFETDQTKIFPSLTQGIALEVELTGGAGQVLDFPQLASLASGGFTVNNGETVNAPLLGSMTGGAMHLYDGGTINAPNLVDVSYQILHIDGAAAQFNTAGLTNIENTRFFIYGGHVFSNVVATYYDSTWYVPDVTILEVQGPGSILDLSSVTLMDVGQLVTGDGVQFQSFYSKDGGILDFSGVTILRGHGAGDPAQFVESNGGRIDFDSLQRITYGRIDFHIESSKTFNFLTDASLLRLFPLLPGVVLDFPVLDYLNGSDIYLIPGVTLNAPLLTNIYNGDLYIEDGSFFTAPSLNDIEFSNLEISGNAQFLTAPLTNIDSVSFTILDGYVLNNIAATSYRPYNIYPGSPIVIVNGQGSVLDLSSVQTVDVGTVWSLALPHTFEASGGGFINLSGVTDIIGTSGDEPARFYATDLGSEIRFGSLTHLNDGRKVLFDVEAQGYIDLTGLSQISAPGPYEFTVSDAGSVIEAPTLCLYEDTLFEEANGGVILSQSTHPSAFLEDLLIGTRTDYFFDPNLFSYRMDNGCYVDLGSLNVPSYFWVDGISLSPSFGVLGFRNDDTNITSRLIQINIDALGYTDIGPPLAERTITGASFKGDTLYAVDSSSMELLTIDPVQGTIIGSPVPLFDSSSGSPLPYNLRLDLAFTSDGEAFLLYNNSRYSLNVATGAVALVHVDTVPTPEGGLPSFTGAAFTEESTQGDFELYELDSYDVDELFLVDEHNTRIDLGVEFPFDFDGLIFLGDLGSYVPFNGDTTPPGPVSVSADGVGNGTYALLNWTSYDEEANGGDIDYYTVYASSISFTDISQASSAGAVPSGMQEYTLTGLSAGQQTFVAVVATDLSGNFDPNVSPISVTPIDVVAPDDASNLTPVSNTTSIDLSWNGSLSPDAAFYRVYQDGLVVSPDIPVPTTTFSLQGLSPSSVYTARVTTLDGSLNESDGISLSVATWYQNPSGVTAVSLDAAAEVSWDTSLPANGVAEYRVYTETTPFTSTSGLTPKATVTSPHTTITGLTNGTTYYIAVTTVNISGGTDPSVTTVTVVPQGDIVGPVLTNPRLAGAPLLSGTIVTGDSLVEVTATDDSGVSRVDFAIEDSGLNLTPIGSDNGSGPVYNANWNLTNFSDGNYTVVITGYDTLSNFTELRIPVQVAYAPPVAPVITSPVSGFLTNESTVAVSGTITPNTSLRIFEGTNLIGGPTAIGASGSFTITVPLSEGANNLTATAEGPGGEGPASSVVVVTLDSSVPDAPEGFSAQSLEDGEVQLSWSAVVASSNVTYDLYRATSSFTSLGSATKINSSPLTNTNYLDLPVDDGTYYYRVVAINQAGSQSEPSDLVVAVSDSTPPSALSIEYVSTGETDPVTDAYGPGLVTATVVVDEPLLVAPFLTISPDGGVPMPVTLVATGELEYQGTFEIVEATKTGTAYAVFSARDLVGNRGTEVLVGDTILIDTDGPIVTTLTVQPGDPIENDQASPVILTVDFSLDEAPVDGVDPEFRYKIGEGTPEIITNVSVVGGDRSLWSGSFTLPSDAGLPDPQNMVFELTALDAIGNVGSTIEGENLYQIYQGLLPPYDIPSGLSATAIAQGKVALSWNGVLEADGYQLYRQDPGGSTLDPIGPILTETNYEDQTPIDGEYLYAIASVRMDNGEQAISAPSPTVSVNADATAPTAPQTLILSLSGQGMVAQWQEPVGGTVVHGNLTYRLYRADLPPATPIDLSGLAPEIDNIIGFAAIDSSPSETEHAYAVTAVDGAGNESPASNTEYLNYSLLPVDTFHVDVPFGSPAELLWSYNGSAATDYKLELIEGGLPTVLHLGPELNFTDLSYQPEERLYAVTAIDGGGSESVSRELLVPHLTLEAPTGLTIKRGVFNLINYTVTNHGATPLVSSRLKVELGGQTHLSDLFTVVPGAEQVVPVIVGGQQSLTSNELLVSSVEVTPNPGEVITFRKEQTVPVQSAALIVTAETQNLTQGATGEVRFTLENTSGVLTEIVTARNTGQLDSDEIRFILTDDEDNTYSVTPLKQFFGGNVITLSNGETVSRIAPSESWTSDWISIPIPANTPPNAKLRVEIDYFHSKLATPQHIAIDGNGTERSITLEDPEYYGEVVSITPQSTFGEVVEIVGRSLDSDTDTPVAFQPIELVLTINGFETISTLTTDANGEFLYEFDPANKNSGQYNVSVVYPGSLDRPALGQFVVDSISVSQTNFHLQVPTNYLATIPVTVNTGPVTSATSVELQYVESDQVGGVFPAGINLVLPPAMSVAAGSSEPFPVEFSSDSTAISPGQVRLRLVSNETGIEPIQFVDVTYDLSVAVPVIQASPGSIDTGVDQDQVRNEHFTFTNNGYAPLLDATIEVTAQQGTVPTWFQTTSVTTIDRLEIGESSQVDLFIAPTTSVTPGIYQFAVNVVSGGQTYLQVPVSVTVTIDGEGALLVHVSDIYTGTEGDSGIITGLNNARIKLLETASLIETVVYTDANGEALLQNLPAGNYTYRVSAPDHQDQTGSLSIIPGVTISQEIFLVNSVISVTWSVTPITIEDYYQINLEAIFETNVPIAVLVLDPIGIQLPTMTAGQVFLGELTLTNYGLIQADNVTQVLPQSDDFVQYEFFGSIPDVVLPSQQITISYRATALQDFDPGSGEGSGGSSCSYQNNYCFTYESECVNGTIVPASICSYWFWTKNCSVSGGDGGSVITGGGGGGPGGPPWTPSIGSLPNLSCVGRIFCSPEAADPGA